MQGTVKATVNPTESAENVVKAVRNLFGDLELHRQERGDEIVIEGVLDSLADLGPLRAALARMKIREAAHALFSRITQEDTISFGLNKQAAYAGHASFYAAGESPLGPIQVTIREDVLEAIEYLCGK